MPERCGIEKNPFSKLTDPTLHPKIKSLPEQPPEPLADRAAADHDPGGAPHARRQHVVGVVEVHQHLIARRNRHLAAHFVGGGRNGAPQAEFWHRTHPNSYKRGMSDILYARNAPYR